MILNVSSRTDIVAFYTEWFINRYNEGFLDVRNPFNHNLVSRIEFSDVDLIMFCTKNPLPIIDYLKNITQPIIFHITLTPYKDDIEPNVPDKRAIIEGIKKISEILGSDHVVVRYDPILLNHKYTLEYHTKAFKKLCDNLDGYTFKYIVSFIDDYKNVQNNSKTLNLREFTEDDYRTIGLSFSQTAKEHNATVQTCFEEKNLIEYGFIKGECISRELAYYLTGKKFKNWKARKCECAEMVDIGVYNSCKHFCKYCYANYDEKSVSKNNSLHDPESSLLIGYLKETDIIRIREK